MAVTLAAPIRISPTITQISWTGDGPTYYVYVDGILSRTTTDTSVQIQASPGEVVQVEVLDDVDAAPTPAHPGRLLLTWKAVTDAAKYRVYEYVTDAWVMRVELSEVGRTQYQWQTSYLDDGTTYQFKIGAVGQNGVEGVFKEVTIAMVRRPDPPDIALTFSAVTGKITVTEA